VRPGQKHRQRRPNTLLPLAECRALLARIGIESGAQPGDRRAKLIHAPRDRWPEITVSAALLIVQAIERSGSGVR